MDEGTGGYNSSCNSFAREARFLQKEFKNAEQPFGWSDISRKTADCNVITMRRFSGRNQYHLSLLRSLRASQVHFRTFFFLRAKLIFAEQNIVVRMSVSSGFRKYRSVFAPLSRLAVAINNHPESAMMKISRAVES